MNYIGFDVTGHITDVRKSGGVPICCFMTGKTRRDVLKVNHLCHKHKIYFV